MEVSVEDCAALAVRELETKGRLRDGVFIADCV